MQLTLHLSDGNPADEVFVKIDVEPDMLGQPRAVWLQQYLTPMIAALLAKAETSALNKIAHE